MRHRLPALLFLVITATASIAAQPSVAAPTRAPSATPALAAPARLLEAPIVRGLYVNRFAAQSPKRMRQLIALADATEINAFVIDIKDEFGLNYASADPVIQRNAGNAGTIRDLRPLLDTLKAHKILAIARIVVFKDSVTARVNPQWTIRTAAGGAWRDKQGLTWVNPYHRELWDYNVRIAEEVVKLGFGEIQFDYIRFPEPYKSLPRQVFPSANGSDKATALAEFLGFAKGRISKLGVRTTADVFGLVTSLARPLEIGQHWETLSPRADVMLPMVYPSHYPRGAFGVARPNADPYRIVFAAISRARERDEKLGIRNGEHVRAWLQAFSLGQPPYGAAELRAQKQAVYDAGYDGWVLWHPGSKYELFAGALDRELVSRKKAPPPAK
ncbi:MAG TPA: putative glycoside hydrolase [Gemmatimonadaceae bacterium]|jgi:hypothetical protein